MANLFKTSPIKTRVMKAINERIERAEKQYEDKCVEIDETAEQQKVAFADLMVNDIIGKII